MLLYELISITSFSKKQNFLLMVAFLYFFFILSVIKIIIICYCHLHLNELSLPREKYIFIYITDYPLHHIIAVVELCFVISSENTAMYEQTAFRYAFCIMCRFS